MDDRIELIKVTKSFHNQTVLQDVNAVFSSGKIYGFTGRNGSGKTVLMKCICGLMTVTGGRILLNGKQLKKDMEYLENMGFLFEHPGFLEDVSAFENLKYIASVNRKIESERIAASIRLVGLNPKDRKRVGKYSLGMRQRLGIAQAVMEDPGILILDEPMNGLDSKGVEQVRDILNDLKARNKIIIIASHYQEDINYLCDEIYRVEEKSIHRIH